MNFDNQIALITGGASGMGKACVQYLQQHGMIVVIWDKQAATDVKADLFITCDVTSEESVEKLL